MMTTAKIKLEEFLIAVHQLGNKSGISFAVMAKYFKFFSNLNDLKIFIKSWPIDVPLAIEFRNPSWFEKA